MTRQQCRLDDESKDTINEESPFWNPFNEESEETEAVSKHALPAEGYLALGMPEESLKEIDRAPTALRNHSCLLAIQVRAFALLEMQREFHSSLHRYLRRMHELQDKDFDNPEHISKVCLHLMAMGLTVEKDAGTVFSLKVFQMALAILPEHRTLWFEVARLLHSLSLPNCARSALKKAEKFPSLERSFGRKISARQVKAEETDLFQN